MNNSKKTAATKKDVKQIKSYYSKQTVVAGYDDRRFSGVGGQKINQTEIEGITKAFDAIEFLKKKDVKVLDLGAGRGRISLPLKKKGFQVFCLDASPEMIKTLKKHFPPASLLLQSIFDPVKTKQKFDAITGLRFFDHFGISDQKKILLNVQNNLVSGGYIVFTALQKNSLESAVSKFFPYGRYNYFYTNDEYSKLFKSTNFKIISQKTYFYLPRGIFLYSQKIPGLYHVFNILDKILLGLAPQNGAYIVYTLQKSK